MSAHFRCTVVNACFLLMAATGRAVAEETDEPAVQSRAAAQSAYQNQLICKRVYMTGSYIPKKDL